MGCVRFGLSRCPRKGGFHSANHPRTRGLHIEAGCFSFLGKTCSSDATSGDPEVRNTKHRRQSRTKPSLLGGIRQTKKLSTRDCRIQANLGDIVRKQAGGQEWRGEKPQETSNWWVVQRTPDSQETPTPAPLWGGLENKCRKFGEGRRACKGGLNKGRQGKRGGGYEKRDVVEGPVKS